MSKRAGETIDLDEVVDEVGVDVLRYHFLRQGLDTTIDFDLAVVTASSRWRTRSTTCSTPTPASARCCAADERGFDARRRSTTPTCRC
jgi:arginyl-tRNA synthetase